MGRACSAYGQRRDAYRVLVGKPERMRPLERPNHRWEDSIKMGLREVRWEGINWIDVVQDRDRWRAVVNKAMNLQVSIKCGEVFK
jgi:hypothetical protein